MTETNRPIRRLAARLALALLPPLLLGLYSLLPFLVPLCLFALVPWIVLYTDDRHPRVSWGYFALGALAAMPLLYPVIFRFGWHFPIAFSISFALPWLVFAPVMRRVHHRWHLPRALSFALVWVGVEWVRATFSLAHFDLFRLGCTQARLTPLIQVADITGVYGVSFLVAAVNGLLADVFFALRDGGGWRSRAAWLQRRNVISAVSLAAAIAAVWTYGEVKLSRARYVAGPRLAIVQPNIRHLGSNAVGVHLAQVMLTDDEVPAGAADLVIWPENAILDNVRRPGAYLEDLAWLAGRKQARFLVGAMGKSPEQPGRTTNAAFLVDERGEILGEYDKQVLFPWSEYVPLDGLLGHVSSSLRNLQRALVRRGWGFMPVGVPGRGMTLFELPWNGKLLRFAVLICVENDYPPIPASAGRQGARFFVNITSEGEVGGPLQEHLLRTCMLRAAENRIAYVRAGNSGVSGFIDPSGRLRRVLVGKRGGTIFDSGVLIDRVPLSQGGPTVYARSRDAFVKLCMAVTLLLLVWPRRRGRPGRPAGAAAAAAVVAMAGVAAPGCTGVPSLGRDAERASAALSAGQQLYASGRPGPALERFAEACADPVACRKALRWAATSFLAVRRPESGAVFFERVAERHPELAGEALGHRGDMLDRSLELREAERSYLAALESSSAAWLYAQLGNLRLRMDDRAGGIEAFREGLRHNPTDVHLRYLLGRALRIDGQLDEAGAILQAVLADDPTHSHAWTNLGRARLAQGDRDAAGEALEQAVTLDDANIEARFQLVRLALREGRREDAERLLQEIRAIESGLGRGHAADEP